MASPPELPAALQSMGQALLIGLLVGFQREAAQREKQAGFRDFILIALTGGVCGLLQNPWLTAAALISIAGLLAAFHLRVGERTGITTEMAAVATFCLGYLTATPGYPSSAALAIGLTIVVTAFLEAKRALQKLVRETITEREFEDTLRFLALIFIIYPLLPRGEYGPFNFFSPRQVWLFVILVSSISYAGYFLQKFLGGRGLRLTAVVGGLASTTAATLAFARDSRERPGAVAAYGQAAVLANAVQFPRVLILLYAVSPPLAAVLAAPLLAMALAGLAVGLLPARGPSAEVPGAVPVGNPFRLAPALKFGALFTAIVFASKAAATLGAGAVYWTSAIGGSVDADAAVVSISALLGEGRLALAAGAWSVFFALLANALLKTALALWAGAPRFARRLALGFVLMFVPGAVLWWSLLA